MKVMEVEVGEVSVTRSEKGIRAKIFFHKPKKHPDHMTWTEFSLDTDELTADLYPIGTKFEVHLKLIVEEA